MGLFAAVGQGIPTPFGWPSACRPLDHPGGSPEEALDPLLLPDHPLGLCCLQHRRRTSALVNPWFTRAVVSRSPFGPAATLCWPGTSQQGGFADFAGSPFGMLRGPKVSGLHEEPILGGGTSGGQGRAGILRPTPLACESALRYIYHLAA